MTSDQKPKLVVVQVNDRCYTCQRPLWRGDVAKYVRGMLYHQGCEVFR